MEKQFQLVKQVADVRRPPIDWSLGFLCRGKKTESLSEPWRGRGRGTVPSEGTAVGYESFERNLLKFQELDNIPLDVRPSELNDGSGISATLQSKRAKWHKSCRKMFGDDKLERQEKQHTHESEMQNEDTPVYSPIKKKMRLSTGNMSRSNTDSSEVFFFL